MSRGVLCFGDNTIDRYLPPLGVDLAGGSCVNVAAELARAGLDVRYAGAVGDDADGRFIRERLRSAGVGVELVETAARGRTAVTEIAVLPDGERRFVSEEYEVNDAWEPSADAWAAAAGSLHVHASRVPRHLDRLRRLAGPTLSYDFSEDEPPADLTGIDVALRSGGDPSELVARGAACGVVTLGASGSVAATAAETATAPATPVDELVDTCGAGDAFIGGFLAARLRAEPLAVCLAAGAASAARACSILGAFPQDPR